MKKLKNLSAVTLTELILVVIIVGILVGFGIPKYQKAIKQAKEKNAIVNLRLIKTAQNIYRAEVKNYYPHPAGGLADADMINTNLKLGLIEDDVTYTCASGSLTSFTCTAGDTSAGWRYEITQSLDAPACSAGVCSY
ncbi:MAG: type II secretion system protein [Candidatus Aceula meridiana]|nr:type II secretion system protein [Candidatus Aceula meridiana]